MKSQNFAMTTATRLAACTLLIAIMLAVTLLVTSRAYAQQNCTRVKMIYAEAWNTLYLVDGNGNRLRDIQSGNSLSNRQIDSFIVVRGTPSSIGVEIEGTGTISYRYRNSVRQSGDRGYEDYIDDDFNDAVILLTSVNCPGSGSPPRQVSSPPRGTNPPPTSQANTVPSVSSVSADSITKTTARAVVNIADQDGTELTVRLRYQEKAEAQDWPNAHTDTATSSTSPATRNLENLTPGTEYVLQASLDDAFPDEGTKEHTFTTKRPPSLSVVSMGSITQTSAVATVSIADSDGSTQTVKLQYREKDASPVEEWSARPVQTESSTGATARIDLSGLTPDTRYEVQVWLASDETAKVAAEFRTLSPDPSLSVVSIGSITQTSAVATVSIADSDGSTQTVKLQYREKDASPVEEWSARPVQTESSTGATARIDLSGLTPDTRYEVQVWLASDETAKVAAEFRTLQASPRQRSVSPVSPDPSLSSVSIGSITQTSAVATVNIADAGSAQKTVYMFFRKFGDTEWSDARPKKTGGASVTYDLTALEAGTTYGVKAYLRTDPDTFKHAVFTTLSLEPEPSVSGISFGSITQTTAVATVNIANAGTAQKTVRLRYRVNGATTWTTESSQNTEGASNAFSLDGLTAGTTYEVQAWLGHATPSAGTTIYTFDTLVNPPSISELGFENIEQTSATAVVDIVDAGTGKKDVFLRYSIQGEDDWTTLPNPAVTNGDDASIDLTELQEQTTYEVAVALSEDFSGMVKKSFTTLPPPSLSGVSIGSVTQTSAVATVSIANAGSGQKTALLQHREFGESEWGEAESKTTSDASVTFNLTGLDPGTTYEVKAYLGADPDTPKYVVFTTLSSGTGVDDGINVTGISVGSITQTSAIATVNIAYPGTEQNTVHLRYRKFGESEWSEAESKTTDGASVTFDLAGLSPKTKYEVEAALNSDFSGAKSATFTTLALEPAVSGVKVEDVAQTTATAIATIANGDGTSQTVRVRHRTTTPQGEWSDTQKTASTAATAKISLFGLTADTEYEVEASLGADFGRAESATFTTLRYPSISNLEIRDQTQNSAIAVIAIADPDGSSQSVYLRYRTTTPQGEWSSIQKTASSNATASLELSGLTTDTEYEVEVSLTDAFDVSKTDIFRTLPPDPVVSKVSVNNIAQTTATASIDIANANSEEQTVHLRYRTTTPRSDWSETLTTTSNTDSARIGLSGLTPGTKYDVQASLGSTFPSTRTKYATFTTLRYPGIASFEAENIDRNGATVTATIADSRGESQTVYVRHRQARYIAWRTTQQTDSVDDTASLRLRGLSSGTEYISEASLDSTFPSGETRSVTFTTKERRDDDDTGRVVEQSARALNVPLPGYSPLTLRFIAVEGGDNPSPQTFSVWNRVYGAMDFFLSNHEEWLTQEPSSSMSSGPNDPVTITASVDSSELAAGQYVDVINIKVSSSGSSPGQIIVMLDVLPPDYIRQFVSRADGGVVMLPGGTAKIVVPSLAPPKDVDIELMKLNLMAHGAPPGERERVIVAIESNTYPPGGDTPEDVAYSPSVELWVMLLDSENSACAEGKTRVYSAQSGGWSLVEHRCETDDSGNVWAVSEIERLGAFALVIDDSPVTSAAVVPASTPVTVVRPAAPALPVQRVPLPAVAPTPVPIAAPTPLPILDGRPTATPIAVVVSASTTPEPAVAEQPAPALQAAVESQDSGGFNGLLLGALGLPLLIGGGIVVFLFYRERRRNGKRLQ